MDGRNSVGRPCIWKPSVTRNYQSPSSLAEAPVANLAASSIFHVLSVAIKFALLPGGWGHSSVVVVAAATDNQTGSRATDQTPESGIISFVCVLRKPLRPLRFQ